MFTPTWLKKSSPKDYGHCAVDMGSGGPQCPSSKIGGFLVPGGYAGYCTCGGLRNFACNRQALAATPATTK